MFHLLLHYNKLQILIKFYCVLLSSLPFIYRILFQYAWGTTEKSEMFRNQATSPFLPGPSPLFSVSCFLKWLMALHSVLSLGLSSLLSYLSCFLHARKKIPILFPIFNVYWLLAIFSNTYIYVNGCQYLNMVSQESYYYVNFSLSLMMPRPKELT